MKFNAFLGRKAGEGNLRFGCLSLLVDGHIRIGKQKTRKKKKSEPSGHVIFELKRNSVKVVELKNALDKLKTSPNFFEFPFVQRKRRRVSEGIGERWLMMKTFHSKE